MFAPSRHAPFYFHCTVLIQFYLNYWDNSLFCACWFTSMRSLKWPGGIFIFQFNGTIVVTLGRNILPFRTKNLKLAELRVAVMSSKIFTRGSLAAIVKGAMYICTTWLLDLLILDMGESAPYIGHLFKAYPMSHLFRAWPSNVLPHREHCNQGFKISSHFSTTLAILGWWRHGYISELQECKPITTHSIL